MAKIVFWSHWDPNSNGTDYWDVLGEYPGYETDPKVREQADRDAWDAASDRYEWQSEEEQEENGMEDEGPDCYTEVYDPDKHDGLRAGGGSFEDDFARC